MATATIAFSVPVSNPHGVEALLAIDEPTPANQVAGVFNGTAPLGVGTGLNFSNGSTANIFPGVQNGANSFLYIFPFDPSPNGRTFTFTNVYLNPNAKPSSSLNPATVEANAEINVKFSDIPAGPSLISLPNVNLGTTVDCFVYQANGGARPPTNRSTPACSPPTRLFHPRPPSPCCTAICSPAASASEPPAFKTCSARPTTPMPASRAKPFRPASRTSEPSSRPFSTTFLRA